MVPQTWGPEDPRNQPCLVGGSGSEELVPDPLCYPTRLVCLPPGGYDVVEEGSEGEGGDGRR